MTTKKRALDLFGEHGKQRREGGMRRDRRKPRILRRVIRQYRLATLMEDVDSESGSQNGLQGVNVEDLAKEKEGTMVTWERPGTPREPHSSGCLYHKQTICYNNSTC